MTVDALLDSNVLIAIVAQAHQHHALSVSLLNRFRSARFAGAAHSFAEAYNTLTKDGPRAPFMEPAQSAWAAISRLRPLVAVLGLTPAQTFDAIGSYAQRGGIGPRLYDRLIGEVAVTHGIATIITWNIGHMRGLFPRLTITTPAEFSFA